MKRQKIKFILGKTAVAGLTAGICCIAASFLFYREDKAEAVWLIVFGLGALMVLYWLIITFFMARCRMCGSFSSIKDMTLIDRHYYCPACAELVKLKDKNSVSKGTSL